MWNICFLFVWMFCVSALISDNTNNDNSINNCNNLDQENNMPVSNDICTRALFMFFNPHWVLVYNSSAYCSYCSWNVAQTGKTTFNIDHFFPHLVYWFLQHVDFLCMVLIGKLHMHVLKLLTYLHLLYGTIFVSQK